MVPVSGTSLSLGRSFLFWRRHAHNLLGLPGVHVFYKNMTVSLATILLLLRAVSNAGANFDSGMRPDGPQKITFPSTINYARLDTTLSKDLTRFTLCLHMRPDIWSNSDHMGLVSYAIMGQHNELLLYRAGSKFRLYVSVAGEDTPSVELPVWDGAWHAICATWSSNRGDWVIYSDGVLRGSGSRLNKGNKVRSGGTWILGQDQDRVGGGFEEDQAFSGELSQVNLWDRVLTPAEITTNWTVSCNRHGNVIEWTATDISVYGDSRRDQYDCASERPEYISLGCWRDTGNRAIPKLEGVDRLLDDSYQQRTSAIEKCYLVALSRGFTVFAVQYGGQCFGSADAHNTYKKHGSSTASANTTNIALNRPTDQSSIAHNGAAGLAVDGNRNPIWNAKSCTHTTEEPNPWWRVDLGSTKYVDRVVIFNRKDCCWGRLNGFQVHVGENSSVAHNPTCRDARSLVGRDVFIVNCGGLTGRYVGISLPATQYLTLCEVEVYGDSAVLASVNVSVTLTAPSSVNLPSLRLSIKQSLETKVKEFCEDQCEIGEIFLHIVNGANRTRKKRQTDDKVQIIVTIQLIVSASQGGKTLTDRKMAENLLQKNADPLRQLAGKLSVDVNGKVYLIDNSDEDKTTPPWVVGVICAAVAFIIIIAVVTVLLCRRKRNPDANMPGKSGNEMKNLDTPERRDHSTGEGSVDNIIYNTEDEGFVDNVIYNAGDDGTVDNVIYQEEHSTPNDPENAPESQYESVY
ncbi:NPTX1 [Branchiostoma lanceolatum]|uniref:NPTX1 protein n=1 Tax=Branchiostoma lanceolatum TaxID=7740 RepID=A0A8K0EU03_BRALA|nr:NPTX1 [Branchiostoma lanceolatum]